MFDKFTSKGFLSSKRIDFILYSYNGSIHFFLFVLCIIQRYSNITINHGFSHNSDRKYKSSPKKFALLRHFALEWNNWFESFWSLIFFMRQICLRPFKLPAILKYVINSWCSFLKRYIFLHILCLIFFLLEMNILPASLFHFPAASYLRWNH